MQFRCSSTGLWGMLFLSSNRRSCTSCPRWDLNTKQGMRTSWHCYHQHHWRSLPFPPHKPEGSKTKADLKYNRLVQHSPQAQLSCSGVTVTVIGILLLLGPNKLMKTRQEEMAPKARTLMGAKDILNGPIHGDKKAGSLISLESLHLKTLPQFKRQDLN